MEAPAGEQYSPFWYGAEHNPNDDGTTSPVAVLDALREYRLAELGLRARTRRRMRMGEKDLLAMRLVMRGRARGALLSPKDLADGLEISSASTTTLIDRLENAGHLVRRPHPHDRRALVLVPTEQADRDVREALAGPHERMLEVARALSDDDRRAIVRFLDALAHAVGPATSADPADRADRIGQA